MPRKCLINFVLLLVIIAKFVFGSFSFQADILFKVFDYNHSGYIEIEEFAQIVIHISVLANSFIIRTSPR